MKNNKHNLNLYRQIPLKRSRVLSQINFSLYRKDVAKLLFFSLITLGSILILVLTPSLLPSTLISILLFFIFSPVVRSLERRGCGRTFSIATLFLFCALSFTSLTTVITPQISKEIEAIQNGKSKVGPELVDKLRAQEKKLIGSNPLFLNLNLTDKTISWTKKSTDRLLSSIPDLASQFMTAIFLVPFLTFIFLRDGTSIRKSVLSLVPNRYFEAIYGIISRILEEMGGYVAARILEAFLVAAMVTAACFALGIPYAFLIGFFAGATNPIPYLGPLIGLIPSVLAAILEPAIPNQLLWIIIIFSVANIIDMLVIFPVVVAKIVDLHPLVVITAVILGSQFFGVLGMILAVPITSIFKILLIEAYERIYSHRHLNPLS